MKSLFEKYRPASWEQVIGQPKAVSALLRLRERGGFGGRAYWIAGASGTGKTTLARLVAADMAESWHVEEIDAQDCTLDYVRRMEDSFIFRGMGAKTGKVWIVNESHGLRGAVLSRFLTALEKLPEYCAIVFTTTKDGQESLFEDFDAPPLMSRCMAISLTSKGLKEVFAQRAHDIADAEGLNGKPITFYQRLAMDTRNNMRAMLSAIEAGAALE